MSNNLIYETETERVAPDGARRFLQFRVREFDDCRGFSIDVQSWDVEKGRFSSPVGCQDYIRHHGKWRGQ